MKRIDVLDAEKRFDELLDRAERGDEIAIIRNGHEIARLIPIKRTDGITKHFSRTSD